MSWKLSLSLFALLACLLACQDGIESFSIKNVLFGVKSSQIKSAGVMEISGLKGKQKTTSRIEKSRTGMTMEMEMS